MQATVSAPFPFLIIYFNGFLCVCLCVSSVYEIVGESSGASEQIHQSAALCVGQREAQDRGGQSSR